MHLVAGSLNSVGYDTFRSMTGFVDNDGNNERRLNPPLKESEVTFWSFSCRNTTGHGSLGEGPKRSEILRVSQAHKPPLEESTEVKRKVVKDTSI